MQLLSLRRRLRSNVQNRLTTKVTKTRNEEGQQERNFNDESRRRLPRPPAILPHSMKSRMICVTVTQMLYTHGSRLQALLWTISERQRSYSLLIVYGIWFRA